jgi:hypothetical protein
MIGRMIRAFGADDVARFRLRFRKLRFQMITDSPRSPTIVARPKARFSTC